MLDPRILAERRDEIAESCRRRRVAADLDGAIAAYEEVARLRGALAPSRQSGGVIYNTDGLAAQIRGAIDLLEGR